MLAIFIFSIAAVSASDVNDTAIASEDTGQMELSASDEITDTLNVNINEEKLTFGNIWYVNSSAINGEGTLDNPFNNLMDTISASSDNDIIRIASGTYAGESNTNLIIDKNLTFERYGDGEVIFNGSGTTIWEIQSKSINITGLTFQNGHGGNGGALLFKSELINSNINANFNNNYASFGGAIYFAGSLTNVNITGNFTKNTANGHSYDMDGGGAICFFKELNHVNIIGNFTDNIAQDNAGANSFKSKITNVNIFGNYNNNTATGQNGGANWFSALENVTITGNFTNNKALGSGGANFFYELLENVNIIGNYINNTASASNGGANRFNGELRNVAIIGDYSYNKAKYGGANYFDGRLNNVNITGNYCHNEAGVEGGANRLGYSVLVNIIGNYTNNTAKGTGLWSGGGAIYVQNTPAELNIEANFYNNTAVSQGAAICFYDSMSNVDVTGNLINNNGKSVIYCYGTSNSIIHDSIFINNSKINVDGSGTIKIVDTWFGNNATNYNIPPSEQKIDFENWLFLNATVDSNIDDDSKISNITFKLSSYNASGVSDYDNNLLNLINLTITATNGNIAGTARLGESVQFTPTSGGTATVTATVENARQTVEIPVKGDFDLLQDLVNNESLSVINLERNYTYNQFDTITDGVVINRAITINGNGYTIDANGKSRIFKVTGNDVALENITFVNGNTTSSGGAVYFSQSGRIINCNFTDNTATGDGGAVYFSNTGTVSNCNFTNNTATISGGAVFFLNTGNVTNCNFINNTANQSGGAVYVDGAYSDSKINSTFINNQAYNGGAIYFKGGINNVSIGGVYKDNVALRGGGAIFVRGNSMNNNFTAEFTGNEARAASGGAIFIYNQADNNRFEGIYRDNWALYGGGIFFYNKANNNVFNTEFINNTAKSCGGAMFFHNTTDGNNFTGDFTNNRALGQVDSENGNGGAITFKDTSSNSLFNSDFINNNASLNGGGVNYRHTPYNITFNSNFINNTSPRGGGVNFFETFENVVFNGEFIGNSADNGGAIATVGGIIMDVSFKDNHAEDEGGAVYFKGSGVVENCIFTNNTADYGGAVYIFGTGEVRDCVFINNTGFVFAGALMMIYGTVSDSSFTGNTAHIGGAVRINGEATVTRCNFTDNTATLEGGAVYLGSPGNVTFSNFIGNKATGDGVGGGAVLLYGGGNVSYSNFTNNHVSTDGGAVHFYDNGTLSYCNFYDNEAGVTGGAVYFYNNGTVSNSNFIGNEANGEKSSGGAICFDEAGNVINSIFTANKATRTGGAIYVGEKSTNNNFSAQFYNNHAGQSGGAIFFRNSVENNTFDGIFKDNTASYGAGIFFYNKANGNKIEGDFINNTAKSCGGAMFFYNTTDKNNFSGSFINNSALGQLDPTVGNGGAITFKNVSTNCVFTCDFINNTASLNGGAVNYRENPSNITFNSNFINNTSPRGGGVNFFGNFENVIFNGEFIGNSAKFGGAIATINGIIKGVSFRDNHAEMGGAIFFAESCEIRDCNFTANTADYGGAIYLDIEFINIMNCNFINNTASASGAAVNIETGNLTDCNFINNTASASGGAVVMTSGNVTNCNFTGNTASKLGGAVVMDSGNVANCNFTNNKATGSNSCGGAIFFASTGNVTNCNFVDNKATSYDGGAIYFSSSGTVENCNFTNNTATNGDGGAIWMYSGSVENCNFTNNSASEDGGAIYFENSGNVTNCNFTNNSVSDWGGAIYMYSGNVENCNFTNNSARYGGAIRFSSTGNVTNCNFTANTVTYYGGAVYFWGEGSVANCNFTGNNATTGSAIYFYSDWATKTVSDSTFLNNRANAEALDVVKNDNNITITFTGRNNLLNAIYSKYDAEVTFTNVTYWGAKGITTVSATLSGSNKAAGQNITVGVVVNNELVLSDVMVTNESGMIVLDISAGENYYISLRHDTDSYYTEAEKTISNNTKFNVNITSQTTHNKTVNITAKSNIFSEVMDGKLLFIVPNSDPITATYAGNGTWWIVYTFDDYAVYKVNATFEGLDNVTVNNGTITINKADSTLTVGDVEFDYNSSGSTTISFTGASGVNANVIGQPNANVNVAGNTITVSGLNAGTYTLSVTTIADADHNNVTKTSTITVNKINSTLTVGDITFDYNSTGSTTVSFTGASGVNASVIGQPNANVAVSGNTITVSGLNAGTYTLSVTTIADSNHNNVTKTSTITVNKINSTLTVGDITFDYNSAGSGSLSYDGATGVNATVVGQPDAVVNVKDDAITVSNLNAGNYTLTVTTIADINHNNVTKTAKITVNKVDSTLTVGDIVFDYNSSGSTTISFEGATGVNASVVGQPDAVVDVNNDSITVSALNAGNYTLCVTTIVDANHNNVTKTAKVTVNKATSAINISLDSVYKVGQSIEIMLIPVNSTGNVYLSINGVNYTVNDNKVAIPDGLANGTYDVVAKLDGDANYLESENTATFEVENDIEVIVSDLVKYYSNPERLIVNVTKNGEAVLNASVMITINGVTYNKTTDDDGIASLAINLYGGNYSADVEVPDYGISKTVDVIVKSNIYAEDVVKVFRNGTQYNALFLDGNGNNLSNTNVSFNINGIIYNRTTNASGWATLNINLGKGSYIVTATNPITGYMKSNNITVISKLQTSDLTKYFRNDTQFVVRAVADDGSYAGAGETVTFNINGVFYNRTTNETGHAKLNINLRPGDYIITSYYDGCSEGNTIHVLPTLTGNDLNMTYGDKSQFTVNLLDGQGNPYANQNITFNINGVFYNRTTDVNGDAKLNINLQAGEYIITSSYGDAVISNKITITS